MNVETGFSVSGVGETWYVNITPDEVEGIPILIVPGGPGDKHNYLTGVAEAFLRMGHPVMMYDPIGSGNSQEYQIGDAVDHEGFVGELEILSAYLPSSPYVVFAHSYGAALALEHALDDLTRPAGLILASAPHNGAMWRASIDERRKEMPERLLLAARKHEMAGTNTSREHYEAQRWYDQHFVCRVPMLQSPGDEGAEGTNNGSAYATMWGPSEMCFNGTLSDWDITFRLKDLDCPTLIVAGRYDSISQEMTELLASLIPRSRVEWFEESSSMPFYEEAAKFARVSNDFLERIGARQL